MLDFDATTDETAYVSGYLPSTYGGNGLTVKIFFSADGETSGVVKWQGAFERGTDDQDAAGFAAAVASAETTVSAVDGVRVAVSIAFTDGAQIDSSLAGEEYRFSITRLNTTSGTNMADDAELHGVAIYETP